jgi:Glycosyltransferase 61
MSLRLRPLSSRVLGKLGASRSLEQAASRSWVVGPAVETASAPARVDDADLARITACPNGRTIEHNVALARGGRTVHLETRAHELRDASIAGGHVFAPGLFMPLGDEPAPWVARKPGRHFDSALLTTTPYGAMYFGHWIVECLPLAMLAKQLGESAVSTITRPSPNQRGYLALLDLREETVEDASFERLVIVEDIGQNDDKLARFHAMRSAARRTLGQGHRPGAGVFFLRGASGERRLLANEAELAEIAARKGLEVMRPQDVPSKRIVEASLDAPIVVGVEGSQLLNGFPWLAPGGTMLALMPPQRFDLILKGPCDALDITFSILVGDARGERDFHIDPAAFERRLDEHLSRGVRPAPRFDAVASTAQPA